MYSLKMPEIGCFHPALLPNGIPEVKDNGNQGEKGGGS